jgi:hypothetical protein
MNDQDFIGMSYQDAMESCQAHGIICRIANVNGMPRCLTEDYDLERLNFSIVNDKVISVRRG